MVHIDRRVTAAAGMFVFSTAVAASLVLLMINDPKSGSWLIADLGRIV
jgi:hypothetical protein